MSNLYNEKFLEGMAEAQEDIHRGRTKRYKSPEDFMKSLAGGEY